MADPWDLRRRLGLRTRIFLFFALIAVGFVAAAVLGAMAGYGRLAGGATAPLDAFVLSSVIAGFGGLGLATAVWWLFDRNVAKPLVALSAAMRARSHAGVTEEIDQHDARYLGDLGPAAVALAADLIEERAGRDIAVARQIAQQARERAYLDGLIAALPVGIVVRDPDDRVVLYNARARDLAARLTQEACAAQTCLGLDRPFKVPLGAAVGAEAIDRDGIRFRLRPLPDLTRQGLSQGGCSIVAITAIPTAATATALAAPLPAPALVEDLSLLDRPPGILGLESDLDDLSFVVFDTETTGLHPDRGDQIVQIGAVRVVAGRLVAGEVFDTLVDPGRPIPAASTQVHGIADRDVAGAPVVTAAVRALHRFADRAVLVAHNAPFDMAFLRREEARIGARFDQPVLDTILLSATLYGITERHDLDSVVGRLGVPLADADRHTALGDARATAEALVRMLPMLRAQGVKTLGDALQQSRRFKRLLAPVTPAGAEPAQGTTAPAHSP